MTYAAAPAATVGTVWRLDRHVDAVIYAGDGNAVAATSSLTGAVWDGRVIGLIRGGQTEAQLEVEVGLSSLATLAEGQFIAGGDDGVVRVVHSGGILPLPGGHDGGSSICVAALSSSPLTSPGGDASPASASGGASSPASAAGGDAGTVQRVASGGSDGVALVWDVASPAAAPSRIIGHSCAVTAVDFPPPSSLVASRGGGLLTASQDGRAAVWDDRFGASDAAGGGGDSGVGGVGGGGTGGGGGLGAGGAGGGDGDGGRGGGPATPASASRLPAMVLPLTGDAVTAAAYAPDGTGVLVATDRCDVALWDVRAASRGAVWVTDAFWRPVRAIAPTAAVGGGVVACGSDCPAVTVLQLGDGSLGGRSFHHADFVRGVAWGGGGSIFSASWDKTVAELQFEGL